MWLRRQLASLVSSSSSSSSSLLSEIDTKRNSLAAELATMNGYSGYWDEFAEVTEIIRSGDNGAHILNRLLFLFESTVYREYGIAFSTHTLCKRHGYSMCDAHASAIYKHTNSKALVDIRPESAHDYANVLNNCAFDYSTRDLAFTYNARTRAYPITNIDRSEKEDVYDSIQGATGCTKMCEFQYNVLDDDGGLVHTPGVVRMKECSGDESTPYQVRDLLYRGLEFGRLCDRCTLEKQRPIYHQRDILSQSPSICPYATSKGKFRSIMPIKKKAPPLENPLSHATFSNESWSSNPEPNKDNESGLGSEKTMKKEDQKAQGGEDVETEQEMKEEKEEQMVQGVEDEETEKEDDKDAETGGEESEDLELYVEKIVGIMYEQRCPTEQEWHPIYRLRWVGYTKKDDTWQTANTIPTEMLEAFHKSKQFESLQDFLKRMAKESVAKARKELSKLGGRGRGRAQQPATDPQPPLTPYEAAKAEQIKRNREMMSQLIPELAKNESTATKHSRPRKIYGPAQGSMATRARSTTTTSTTTSAINTTTEPPLS